MSEGLRYSVVSEHSQLIYIFKFSRTLATEVSPNISDKYLCSLVKVDLMTFVYSVVLKIRKVACKNV
jgi:hypothetical protein